MGMVMTNSTNSVLRLSIRDADDNQQTRKPTIEGAHIELRGNLQNLIRIIPAKGNGDFLIIEWPGA